MCREQLPVWQRFWNERARGRAALVTVAADADAAAAAEHARVVDAPTLIDADGALARAFGYRAIPNGFCFGPDGELRDAVIPRFEIRDDAIRARVEGWLAGERAGETPAFGAPDDEALALFQSGVEAREVGRREEALRLWHRAYLHDPKSFVIRKQIWRELYPERFGERIDLDWQREQIAREKELGFSAANPALPPA